MGNVNYIIDLIMRFFLYLFTPSGTMGRVMFLCINIAMIMIQLLKQYFSS